MTVKNKVSPKTTNNAKRNSSNSPSASLGLTKANTTGPGRTPQTRRRELVLPHTEKNSQSVSPRTRESVKHHQTQPQTRKINAVRSKPEPVGGGTNEESTRKSSSSSQDSGIGRDIKPNNRQERTKIAQSVSKSKTAPVIRTTSPETVELEVSNRKKFEDLCDVNNVEMGIVKVSLELLQDLIHKGTIETYYDVDPVPVAR